jgi:hypothetical protein
MQTIVGVLKKDILKNLLHSKTIQCNLQRTALQCPKKPYTLTGFEPTIYCSVEAFFVAICQIVPTWQI